MKSLSIALKSYITALKFHSLSLKLHSIKLKRNMHEMTVCTFRWDCSLENVNANNPDCEKDKNCETWKCEKLQWVNGGSKTPHFYYHKMFTLKLFLMLQGWIKDTLTMANEHSETTQAGINRTIQWKQMRNTERCYSFIIFYFYINLEPFNFRQRYKKKIQLISYFTCQLHYSAILLLCIESLENKTTITIFLI